MSEQQVTRLVMRRIIKLRIESKKVTCNEQKVMSKKENVNWNEQKLESNYEKVRNNEQEVTRN